MLGDGLWVRRLSSLGLPAAGGQCLSGAFLSHSQDTLRTEGGQALIRSLGPLAQNNNLYYIIVVPFSFLFGQLLSVPHWASHLVCFAFFFPPPGILVHFSGDPLVFLQCSHPPLLLPRPPVLQTTDEVWVSVPSFSPEGTGWPSRGPRRRARRSALGYPVGPFFTWDEGFSTSAHPVFGTHR